MSIVQTTLAVANLELGKNIREVAWNDGPRIREYLASVAVYSPAAWCAGFVYWCIREASQREKLRSVPLICSGSCPDIFSWASRKRILSDRPSVGDVFLLRDGNAQDPWSYYHTGLVTAIQQGRVSTIEGNTNGLGSDEGDGVYANSRGMNLISFVNWSSLVEVESYALFVGQDKVCDMPVINGTSWCPVRKLVNQIAQARHVQIAVQWDSESQRVVIDGRPLAAAATLIEGAAHASLRALLAHLNLPEPKVDNQNRRVTL